MLFMAFVSVMISQSENGEAKLFVCLLVIAPMALLLWIQVRGTVYQIKDGVLIQRKYIGGSECYLKLTDVKQIEVKPVFLDTGHLTLHTVAGRVTLKNIPGLHELADAITGKERTEKTIRPSLRAFYLEFLLLLVISYPVYISNDTGLEFIYSLFVLCPALAMLLVAMFGRKYVLKEDTIYAVGFLRHTQGMNLNDVVDLTIKRVGLGAGHMILHGPEGQKMQIKNIRLLNKDLERVLVR
jgi:hypothetical protein